MFSVKDTIWGFPQMQQSNRSIHTEEEREESYSSDEGRTSRISDWLNSGGCNFSSLECDELGHLEWEFLSSKIFPPLCKGKDLALAFQWVLFLLKKSELSASCYLHGNTLGKALLTEAPTYFQRLCNIKNDRPDDLSLKKTPPLQYIFQFKEENPSEEQLKTILDSFKEGLGLEFYCKKTGTNTWTLYYKEPLIVITLVFGKYQPKFISEDCLLKLDEPLNNWNFQRGCDPLKPQSLSGSGIEGLVFAALRVAQPIEDESWKDEEIVFNTIEAIASGYFLHKAPPMDSLPDIPKAKIEEWIARWGKLDPNFAFSLYLHGRIYFPEIFAEKKIETLPLEGLIPLFDQIAKLEAKEDGPLPYLPVLLECCVFLSMISTPTRVEYFKEGYPTLQYQGEFLLSVPLFSPKKGASLSKLFPKTGSHELLPIFAHFFSLSTLDKQLETLPKGMDMKVNSLVYIFLDSPHPLLRFLSLHLLSLTNSRLARRESRFLLLFPLIRKLFREDWSNLGVFLNKFNRTLRCSDQKNLPSTYQEFILALLAIEKYQIAADLMGQLQRSKIPFQDQKSWVEVLLNCTIICQNTPSSLPLNILAKLCLKLTSSFDTISEELFSIGIHTVKELAKTHLKLSRELCDGMVRHKNLTEEQAQQLDELGKIFGYQQSLSSFEKALSIDVVRAKQVLIKELIPNKSLPFLHKERLVRMVILKTLKDVETLDLELLEEWIDLVMPKLDLLLPSPAIKAFFFEVIRAIEFPLESQPIKAKLSKCLPPVCRCINETDKTENKFALLWKIYILGIPLPVDEDVATIFLNTLSSAVIGDQRKLKEIFLLYRASFKNSLHTHFDSNDMHKPFVNVLVDRSINEDVFDNRYFQCLKKNGFPEILTLSAIYYCHNKQDSKKIIEMVNALCTREETRRILLIPVLVTHLQELYKNNDPSLPRLFLKMSWLNQLKPEAFQLVTPLLTAVLFVQLSHADSKSIHIVTDLFIKFITLLKDEEHTKVLSIVVCEVLSKFKASKKLYGVYHLILEHKIFQDGEEVFEPIFKAVALTFAKKKDSHFFELVSQKKVLSPKATRISDIDSFLQNWVTILEQGCRLLPSLPNKKKNRAIKIIENKLQEIKKALSCIYLNSYTVPNQGHNLPKLHQKRALAFKAGSMMMCYHEEGFELLSEQNLVFVVPSTHCYFEKIDKIMVRLLGILLSPKMKFTHKLGREKLKGLLSGAHRPQVWEELLPLLQKLLKMPLSKETYDLITQLSSGLIFLHQNKYPFRQVVNRVRRHRNKSIVPAIFAGEILSLGLRGELIGHEPEVIDMIYPILDTLLSVDSLACLKTLVFELIKLLNLLDLSVGARRGDQKQTDQLKYYIYLCKFLSINNPAEFSPSLVSKTDDVCIILADPDLYSTKGYRELFNTYLNLLTSFGKSEMGSIPSFARGTITLLKTILIIQKPDHKRWMLDMLKAFLLTIIKEADPLNKKPYLSWAAYLVFYMRRKLPNRRLVVDRPFLNQLKPIAKDLGYKEFEGFITNINLGKRCEKGALLNLINFDAECQNVLRAFLIPKGNRDEKMEVIFQLIMKLLKQSETHKVFGAYAFRKLSSIMKTLSEEKRIYFVKSILTRFLPKTRLESSQEIYFSRLFGEFLCSLFSHNLKSSEVQLFMVESLHSVVKTGIFRHHPTFVYAYCFFLAELDTVTLIQITKVLNTHEKHLSEEQVSIGKQYRLVNFDHWCASREPLSNITMGFRSNRDMLAAITITQSLSEKPVRFWLW